MGNYFFIILGFLCFNLTACKGTGKESTNNQSAIENNSLGFETPVNSGVNKYYSNEDSLIFKRIINKSNQLRWDTLDWSDLILQVGKEFLGTPYIASTLERDGDESLVINLCEMDCTTFMEYVIGIAFSIHKDAKTFDDFTRNLVFLRYRNGILEGYPSRLHYFTDWMVNNSQKGILEIVSNEWGNEPMPESVSFMSSNPHFYRQLSDPEFVQQIKETEQQMASYNLKYLTKDLIDKHEHLIMDGDIIAFKTSIKGLDVSHTAFAIHVNNRLHILHASLNNKEVEISAIPLHEYLMKLRNVDGILVARIGH